MHLDVLDLRNFYYRTGLGRAAQRTIRDKITKLWPSAKSMNVVGFGFAAPVLRPYLPDARRVICLMPGPQGVMPWPAGQPNTSVLCHETLWPLADGQVDRLIVLHGLETSENPTKLLGEANRVLSAGGKALFVVPNRSGLWSRSDRTPFGYGRPYSLRQLEAQLKQHGFMPERHVSTLYHPPSDRRFWLKTANFWERIGRHTPIIYAGGVLIVEASKEVYVRPSGLAEAVKRPLRVLEGITKPEVKPV